MDNSMQIHLARIYLPFTVVEDRRIIVNKNIFLKNNFVALLTFTARILLYSFPSFSSSFYSRKHSSVTRENFFIQIYLSQIKR